ALVHDFLTQIGGAERVLEELHGIFPQAPVYTIVYDRQKTERRYEDWKIKTSWLQYLPGGVKRYKWFLALMPLAVTSWNFRNYDLIFSDSSAFVKGVKSAAGQPHICYCHTPTRYLWSDREKYVSSLPYPFFVKILLRPILAWLKKWDLKAATRPSVLIANSQEVKSRIKRFYGRDAPVLYPPVNTDFFDLPKNPPSRSFFLTVGRMEPYKKIEIALEACSRLGLPLKIVGTGSQLAKLKARFGRSAEFLGRVSDEALKALYQNAKALIFPALEDAGMAVVEAMACGTPVLAYGAGGATEFVITGITGELFGEQSSADLAKTLMTFSQTKYSSMVLRERALLFSRVRFREKILKIVYESQKARSTQLAETISKM
ncbi:MAG: glycosyltransferase, partial [Candidatus Doudnabacteria bacterium]|nr:glycosyltransferase [Candidatus Doudnabacteria bacterium]